MLVLLPFPSASLPLRTGSMTHQCRRIQWRRARLQRTRGWRARAWPLHPSHLRRQPQQHPVLLPGRRRPGLRLIGIISGALGLSTHPRWPTLPRARKALLSTMRIICFFLLFSFASKRCRSYLMIMMQQKELYHVYIYTNDMLRTNGRREAPMEDGEPKQETYTSISTSFSIVVPRSELI